jgi:tripartite-type tricarboxylate transporter receptor subunit TctC
MPARTREDTAIRRAAYRPLLLAAPIAGALLAAVTLLAAALAPVRGDEGFPSRSIGIKVPFAPGGAGDILGRTVAQYAGAATGWPFYVENITGAAGLVGAQAAAHAPPDGYTLLLCNIACATNQYVLPEAKWDAKAVLTAVFAVGYLPNILVAGPSVPAGNLTDFIKFARGKTEPLAIATSGPGTSSALTAELFEAKTGIKIREIPYRGSGEAMPDLLAGRVDGMFMGIPESLALIHDGKARPLGVTSKERTPSLPDVPSIAEAVPGYQFVNWSSFFVPKGTPPDIVGKLNDGFNKALASPELLAKLNEMSFRPVGGPPAVAAKLLDDDLALWRPILLKQTTEEK